MKNNIQFLKDNTILKTLISFKNVKL